MYWHRLPVVAAVREGFKVIKATELQKFKYQYYIKRPATVFAGIPKQYWLEQTLRYKESTKKKMPK